MLQHSGNAWLCGGGAPGYPGRQGDGLGTAPASEGRGRGFPSPGGKSCGRSRVLRSRPGRTGVPRRLSGQVSQFSRNWRSLRCDRCPNSHFADIHRARVLPRGSRSELRAQPRQAPIYLLVPHTFIETPRLRLSDLADQIQEAQLNLANRNTPGIRHENHSPTIPLII